MVGIAGWVGHRSAQLRNEGMLRRLPRIDRAIGTADSVRRDDRWGAAFASAGDGTALASVGSIRAALWGRPAWTDVACARQAAAEGMCVSLATAFSQLGPRLLDHLRGHFAIAIADGRDGRVLLAIDRGGVGTLAYAQSGTDIFFGSGTDMVAGQLAEAPGIDPQSIYDYLFFHMVPAPQTIYAGVRKLRPGEYAWRQEGNLVVRPYWEMKYVAEAGEPHGRLHSEFRELLRASVARAATGEGVATFLSGGTDSSTVTGMLAGLCKEPLAAFSIGFDVAEFDETHYATLAARHFGVRHHIYRVTPDDVESLAGRAAAEFDEPFGNASAIPTACCAQQARAAGYTVLLAGDGGDELFGGNARYARQKLFRDIRVASIDAGRQLQAAAGNGDGRWSRVPVMRKLGSYVRQASVPLPDRLESYNFLLRGSTAGIIHPDLLEQIDAYRPFELMRSVYARADTNSVINRMMHLDLELALADNDLRKVGRMCQLAGIEARFPFMDDAVMEFAGRLTPEEKVNGLKLRYFFKRALRTFLPDEVLRRRNMASACHSGSGCSRTRGSMGLWATRWRASGPGPTFARNTSTACSKRTGRATPRTTV